MRTIIGAVALCSSFFVTLAEAQTASAAFNAYLTAYVFPSLFPLVAH